MEGRKRPVPVLFERPSQCCGCRACLEACPVFAIEMREDESGFAYPFIDQGVCVRCGRCKQVCGFQHEFGCGPAERCYAAATSETEIGESASGGVFGALARAMVSRGGVVFGCANEAGETGLHVRHRSARTATELEEMYGSKYVQSSTEGCFREVERELRSGGEVLFSGTPCQVAGLRGYLGCEHEGLLTVDLVCHGVPSERMLREYLSMEFGGGISDVRFRPKCNGWDDSLRLQLAGRDAPQGTVSSEDSSYYDLFLGLRTLRDSCYECPFAGPQRAGDLTIGDFWGVDEVRHDLLDQEGGPFSLQRGVSCLLVNTARGARWLDALGGKIVRERVSFEDISSHNDQLRHPAEMPDDRGDYLRAFADGGWSTVDRLWRRKTRRRRAVRAIKRCIPVPVKQALKRLVATIRG